MLAHEYSIGGHNRASVGRYLAGIAAIAATVATTLLAGIGKIMMALGLPSWAYSYLAIAISAGVAYGFVYWIFNKYAWKALSRVWKIPNIDGDWKCSGQSLDDDGTVKFDWNSTIKISQDWEKIHIKQKTEQSSSNSVSAALIPCGDGTYLLMYSYRNEPRTGEPELQSHLGYCELQFEKDLKSATGEYFTAKGRKSFGRISITRAEN